MAENKDGAFSPKTLVDNYIRLKAEADVEYAAKIKDLTDKSAKVILGACNIHIGDVFITQRKAGFGKTRDVYYKVTNIKADISGIVTVYGTKRKQDKTWSKREGVYMFTTSLYTDFKVDKEYTYIPDYNDEHID
nr:MAG TPA: hypothetical protein [Crassvirales sp.]